MLMISNQRLMPLVLCTCKSNFEITYMNMHNFSLDCAPQGPIIINYCFGEISGLETLIFIC